MGRYRDISVRSRGRARGGAERLLMLRILSAAAMAGLASVPYAAFASSITNGQGTSYQETGAGSGVYDVMAQRVYTPGTGDSYAVNRFKDFKIDRNNTANLYFHTKENASVEAADLINFVDSRIDVNGTVNAIRNNRIGGNLYFLSPDGMAVGSGGVINTGSLYVMTPAVKAVAGEESSYSDLRDHFVKEALSSSDVERIRTGDMTIPLNAAGTITVLGRIHAAGDVKMYAPKIGVGKNVSGVEIDGTAADGIVKAASIQTGVTDFSSLVSLTEEEQASAVLTNLQAEAQGNGDIVLAAKAEYSNSTDQMITEFAQKANVTGSVPRMVTASVDSEGTLDAKGNLQLTAEATNGNLDLARKLAADDVAAGKKFAGDSVQADDASGIAKTYAGVSVGGSVTAGNAVTLRAEANNTYIDNGKTVADKISNAIGMVIPVSVDAGVLNNEAAVTIGKDASVTGKTVAAEAKAVVEAGVGAESSAMLIPSSSPTPIPAFAATYAKVTNNAGVTVDGSVRASGADTDTNAAVHVAASAKSNTTNTATVSQTDSAKGIILESGTSNVAAALAVTKHENNARVNLNGTIEAEAGSVKAESDVLNQLTSSAKSEGSDQYVLLGAAVDVFLHDSTASIDQQGTIRANKDVQLLSTNTMDKNNHTGAITLGANKYDSGFMKAADYAGIGEEIKKLPGVGSMISQTIGIFKEGGTGEGSIGETLAKTFNAGAGVLVADEKDTSSVNFGRNSTTIASAGNLTAKADTVTKDTVMKGSAASNSFDNGDGSTKKAVVSAGVAYASMNQQALVTVEDGKDGKNAVLTAGGDLTLKSNDSMEYNRIERLKKKLDSSIAQLEFAISLLDQVPEAPSLDLGTKSEGLLGDLKKFRDNFSEKTADISPESLAQDSAWSLIGDLADQAMTLQEKEQEVSSAFDQITGLDKIKAILGNTSTVIDNALAFTKPVSYGNVSASASSKGGKDTKISFAGAVSIMDFDYTSHVTVRKNASLSAGKNLNLSSVENIKDVIVTGKNKFWKNDAAAGDGPGIGGSFNYQMFDSSALVQVDAGAELTAGDMNLSSSSDIFHVGAMLSAGKAGGSPISGMGSVTNGSSKNEILVDKDARLTASRDSTSGGMITLSGHNNTNVNNAILAFSAGHETAAAGISVAVNHLNVINRADIMDLDNAYIPAESGFFRASAMNLSAETTGLINAITVAGGLTSSGERAEEDQSIFDKLGNGIDKMVDFPDNVDKKIFEAVSAVSSMTKNIIGTFNESGASQGGTQTASQSTSKSAPSFSLGGAGSVSVNLTNDTTEAIVDGAKVELDHDGNIQAGARDTSFIGAWSGAAAMSVRKGDSSGRTAAIGGAAGANDIDNTVTAAIKNSTLTGVKNMNVEALSGGTAIAAGLGEALTSSDQEGSSFAGGAAVSVSLINKNVTALAENDNVTGAGTGADEKADIKVAAYESDIEGTGGGNIDAALGDGTVVGGGIAVARLNNQINAAIRGGSYTNIGSSSTEALLAAKQVTAALSTGIAAGSGSGSKGAFTGAILYNRLINHVDASLSGTEKFEADSVSVLAHDTSAGSAEAEYFQNKLGDYKKHQAFAEAAGIDTDGSSFYKDKDGNSTLETSGETADMDDKGSLSVGAALVIAGSSGNAAGAAVNVSDRDIDFSARIDSASIDASSISVNAEADTLGVDVSAGIAAGTDDFGGAGSVVWQTEDNDILAQAADSNLKTDKLSITASGNAREINAAGTVGYGKTIGLGASLSYNKLSNEIHAYLAGGTLMKHSTGGTIDLDVLAENQGKLYAFGANAAVSSDAEGLGALSGVVAANHGGTDTEAVIGEAEDSEGQVSSREKTSLSDVSDASVRAESRGMRLAVVGNVDASMGKAAIGGAVAYNDVGGAGTGKAGQKTRAAIVNASLASSDGGKVSVQAKDASTLTTVAVGIGGAKTAAIEGAAATALVNKAITSEIKNSEMKAASGRMQETSVSSESGSKIVTTAVAGAGSGTASVGAGVSVNRIKQDTKAGIEGSQITDRNTLVEATGNSSITSIGIGAAAAGNAGIAGNVAVNKIGNDVDAEVLGSTISSTGNISVLANGRENLGNYAGALGISAGKGGAGVGVSVSYNEITGSTDSLISGSTLTADGSEEESTSLTQSMDKDGIKTEASVDGKTVSDKRKGVIAASYGQHDLQSVSITGGIAAGGSAGVGAAGTVTINKIGGETKAVVTNTAVNETLVSGTSNDVTVQAKDRTNSESHTGSLSLGVGSTAGVGIAGASDTLVFDRTTQAELSGDLTSQAKKKVNGRMIDVQADQVSNILTNADGVAISAGGSAAVSGAATVAVTKLSGTAKALMQQISSTNNGLSIHAVHDHHTTLVSASGAVGAGAAGAALGAGIGVVNDNFTTAAILSDSENTSRALAGTSSSGGASVKADSSTAITTAVVGAAASLGGASLGAGVTVAVNNVNSTTSAETNRSTVQADDAFAVDAHNHVKTDFHSVEASVGMAAIGAGVGINTIGTGTAARVTDSTITAKSVDTKSREELDINQNMIGATAGGLGVNANVMITTIGTKAAPTYGTSGQNNASFDTDEILSKANGSLDAQNGNLEKQSDLIGSNAGVTLTNDSTITASAGNDAAAGTQTVITGTHQTALDGSVTVSADRETNAHIKSDSATLSAGSLSATVAVLDAKKDAGVSVDGSVLEASKDVSITALQHGETAVNSYQANLALAGTISAAYAKNKSNGATRADVASSHIKGIDTTILAEDTGSTTSGVYGISGALLFSGGALITNTENTSSTDVSLTGGSVISSTGEANITSRKANTVSADALGGSVGAAALQGIVAEAKDSGNSTITVTGENQVSGTAVSLLAEESPRVRAEARAYNGALLGAGGASIAKADASGTVSFTVGDGSLFKGDSVSMNAAVWEQNDGTSTFDTAHAEAVGVSGALLGSFQANTSEASQETQVLMDIGNSTYYADNLTIIGSNSSVLHSLASGVSVGGAIAKGENISRMSGTKTTHVAAKGARDGSSLGTVTIRSNAYNNLSGNASGSGGGIVNVSDTAAASDTRLATDTKNTISGDWKALLFTASATNSDDISTTADSLSAAVIGASGTDVKTNISHAAAIDVTGNIETTGGQTYRAVNSVNHDVKLLGNGYGAVSINSNTMDNTLSYKTSVNLHNASLSSEDGSLAVLARTEGKMNYKNQMKSAGAIPSTNAHSTNTLTYDNSVLASDVTMRTFSEDQDIVLAATDNTDATFATLADTQGGAVGAASAVTENTLSRSNTTSFTGGLLESTNDAGLYAGSDADGISSSLDYNITADAYNKTAVPIHTKPSVSNTMSQANHVLVDGTIRSVRHTNLKADEGLTTVAESAVEYNNYTKDGGQGSITSTANGKRNSHETTDNYVEIGAAGSVLAGIHTDLDLLIEGNAEYNANGEIVQENGEATVVPTFNLDNIYASVKDGQDWFNPGDITIGRVTLHNDLMARYLDISAKKGQYDPESKEAKGLDQELDDIIELMKINGFVKNDSIIDEMEVAAITLPAIVVSGGNVNIEADKVKGSGSITAQGANSVNVTSTSNLYLKTDDIVIKDKGGEIRYKGGVIANGEALSEFAGSVSSSSADGAEPSITITSKGSQLKAPLPDDPSKTITVTTPDIGIFGAIRNASGDVSINNSNGSILVDSKAVVSGRNIKLHTDHGAVSQISDGWNLVGSDPVTRWQFSDSIAEKIQQYPTKAANLGWNVSWLTSQGNYDAYKANLLAYGAKELNLTPGELDTIRNASDKAERGIVAEKDVYLSGKNVIINGLIQSGYGTYKTVLTSADKARVNDIEKRWKKNMQALTDERVLSNSDYIVNEGGSYYNAESGQWEYEVKIYYNPDTGRLLAENLEPVGGGIYITGAIASTNGSGRLLAMDGTPDISIDTTAVDKELMLNTIENHRLGGRISIQDTALNTKTVLTTSDGIINTSVSAIDGSEASQNRITGSGSTVLYKPAEQLLNWTGGISGSSTGVDYQYSKKFLAWGFLPYAKSNTFINDASVSGGKVQTSSSTTVGDKNLESGQYISMGTQSPLYSSTTTVTQSGETKVTPVVVDKRYKGKWGKVFGYGTAYYTWRETKDTSTSTTYSIKADLPISAGFISGSKDTISIRADKDVFLSGNISSGTPDGTVSLEIQNGGVISDGGARVVTDHLNVSAKDDVFLMHSALGTDARVSLESTNGTSSLYSDKGNLTVTKGHAGGGEFTIQSAGNLKTEGSTAITSDRITLESTKGSIHVIANAAVSPKNSDPLWASINADAAGDIQITNTNGNMRVGHIISHNGNVTLTTNGSFEDATSGGTISSSTDKLQEWEDMGLISDAEDAASRKAAAESARAERWQAIEARGAQLAQSSSHTMENYEAAASAYAEAFAGDADMQAAKTTYEKIVKANPDNQLALDNAYKDFDAARKAFLEGLGYSEETGYTAEERDFIINAGEIKGSDAYGWSRNDLLYAIQNTVLNSKPRDEILTVDSPNVKGNNITLNAGYNIGANAAPVTISYDEINTLENLRILSAADAGDLKWDDDKNTLTIRQQRPLTIQTPGTVTIHSNMNGASGAGSVYLAGVKNTTLNVTGTIHTDADVKLLSDQGIIMNSGSITAHNLIVEGGKGDIGSADNYIETDLAGSLDARTAGNLYIHQMALGAAPARALTVQSIDAGHVVLDSDAGTVMTTETGKTMGYIDGDIIELKTKDGALGLAADGLRIRNNGGILSAEAKTDGQGIYLSGKESGALKLSEVTAGGDFKIESEGTVDAGVLANEEAGISAVSSTIAADNVSFKTLGAVHLVNDTIETAETGDTSLEASGEITQNTSHTIQSGSLTVKASGGVDMETNTSGTANKFATINLTALAADKDVLIENAHDISTTVNIAEGTTTNSITVTNNSAADSSNVIIHGAGTAETYIRINNEKGTIKTDSDLTAKGGSLTLSAKGSVTNEGALAGKDGVSITSAGGTITNKGEVSSSAGSISMETTGNIENDEAVTAKTTASITSSAGTVYNKKAVSGETGVTMSSASALTNDAAVSTSSGAISMEATGNIQNSGDVSGKNEIKLNSTGGSLTNSGVVTSSAGNVDMDASGNIENAGAVNAKTTAAITSSSGSIHNSLAVSGETGVTMNAHTTLDNDAGVSAVSGSISMEAIGNITNIGDIGGKDTITMNSAKGNLVNGGSADSLGTGAVSSTAGGIDLDAYGSIQNYEDVTGALSVTMTASNGRLANMNDVTSSGGSITMETPKEAVNQGQVSGRDGVTISGDTADNMDTISSALGGISVSTRSILVNSKDVTAKTTVSLISSEGYLRNKGNVSGEAGVVMDGDTVTNDKDVSASSGSISLTADKNVTQEGALDASGDVSLASETEGYVALHGGLSAGGLAAFTTKDGSIYVGTDTLASDLSAGTTVSMTAGNGGEIKVYGDMASRTGTTLKASGAGAVSVTGGLTASGEGSVNVTSETGAVTLTGDVSSGKAVYVKTTSGDIKLTGDVTTDTPEKAATPAEETPAKAKRILRAPMAVPQNGFIVESGTGTITASGDITAAGGPATLMTDTGDINYTGTMSTSGDILFQTRLGNIHAGGEDNASSLTSTGGTAVLQTTGNTTDEKGNIILYGSVSSSGGTTLSTNEAGNIIVSGSLLTTGEGDVTAKTKKGIISLAAGSAADPVIASGKDIILETENGGISTTGSMTASKGITVDAGEASVILTGAIEGRDGLVTIHAADTDNTESLGNIEVYGNVTSGTGAVSITTDGGSITLGKATALIGIKAGTTADIETDKGDITIGGVLTTKKGAKILARTKGDLSINGKVASEGGNVEVTTPEGTISLAKTASEETIIDSAGTALIDTGAGNILLDGNIESGLAAIIDTAKGYISQAGDILSGGLLTIHASNPDEDETAGNIILKGNVTSSGDAVSITTDDGSITIGENKKTKKVIAKKGINLQTNNGDILMYGGAESGEDTTIQTTESGDIDITGKLAATGGSVSVLTEDGSISLSGEGEDPVIDSSLNAAVSTGTSGDIDITNSIKAEGKAAITTYDGQITLEGSMGTKKGILVEAKNSGDVSITGDLSSPDQVYSLTEGNITVSTANGDIDVTGNVDAYNNAELSGLEGHVNLTGDITSESRSVWISASDRNALDKDDGNINIQGSMTAPRNLTAATNNGTVQIGSDAAEESLKSSSLLIKTDNGDLDIYAAMETNDDQTIKAEETGNIRITGHMAAAREETGAVHILANEGSIDIIGDEEESTIYAGKGAEIRSTTGGIEMEGNILAGGDTSISTAQGSIGYDGNLETTEGNVTIEAHDEDVDPDAGNIDIIGDVTSAGALSLEAENGSVEISGNLLAKDGPASITASGSKDDEEQGDVLVYGDVTSSAGDVSIGTNYGSILIGAEDEPASISAAGTATISNGEGAASIHGDVSSKEGTTVKTTSRGSIEVTGTLETTGEGDVEVLVKEGDIHLSNMGEKPAVRSTHDAYVETKSGSIAVTGDVSAADTASLISTGGKISLTGNMEGVAGNAVIHASDVEPAEDVKGDIEIKGSVTAGDLLHISTDNGHIMAGTETEKSTLSAGNTAMIQTGTGDISIYGNAGSVSDMDIEAAKEGNILAKGNMSSDDGTVSVHTKKGAIDLTGGLEADGDIGIRTEEGDISLSGNAAAEGSILAGTDAGSITQTGGNLEAGADMTMKANEGSLDIGGALVSEDGVISLATTDSEGSATAGNVTVRGKATAGHGYITASADDGNIEFLGAVTAGGDVSARTEEGNIHYGSTIQSGANIDLETAKTGNITLDGTVDAAGRIDVNADETGSITLRSDLTSESDARFATNNGSIFFEGLDTASEDIHVTSKEGNVELMTTGNGDIRDGWLEDNGDHAVIKSEGGDLTITHTGTGDIDLYSLYALKRAGTDVKDGDIVIDTVDGDVVAIITRNPDKNGEATHITAGSRLETSGTHIDIGSVAQREGYTTPLEFASSGASDDRPIENFVIGDLKGGTDLIFDHLWMKNGYISVSGGTIEIDKLYVEDRAYFSNGTMSTQVFGTTPIAGKDISTTYWNNTSLNRPGTDLETWLSDGNPGRWMYLYFDGGANTQLSNGNLVEVKPYNHVYSQRYSMAEEMARETGKDGMTTRITRYNPGRAKFDHEDLVDTSQIDAAIEDKTEKKTEIKVEE